MRRINLQTATDEQLLDLRFCDLPLSVDAPFIAKHLRRLHRELDSRGLSFRPHVWLADEFFSVDGVPGFAIPFYLAHPRLMRLERRFMGEVEGGNSNWMMRILRHETGHAYDTAFRLRRRKDWRETFGKASIPYPRSYRPNAASRDYVLHLGSWYAQAHPTEDFAETFATWLQPRSTWRHAYERWPRALAKLEFVDALTRELRAAEQKVKSRAIYEPLAQNRRTLRSHYARELRRYTLENSRRYDRWLTQAFAPRTAVANGIPASRLLREWRRPFARELSRDLRLLPYHAHNVIRALIERCEEADFVARKDGNLRGRTKRMIEKVLRAQCAIDRPPHSRQQYIV